MLAGGSAEVGACRATAMSMPAATGHQQTARATPKQMRKSKTPQAGILARSNAGEGGPRSAITSSSASAKTATIMTARPGGERGNRTIVSGGGKGGSSVGAKKQENVGGFVDGVEMYLGLIGWRKKCLYTLLLLLMLLIITNLVLTLWILKVMEFSTVSKVVKSCISALALRFIHPAISGWHGSTEDRSGWHPTHWPDGHYGHAAGIDNTFQARSADIHR